MRYPINIEDVKKDDILYKTMTSKKLFMKGDYCRVERKYYAEEYEDINSGAYFKKGKVVYVEYDSYYDKKMADQEFWDNVESARRYDDIIEIGCVYDGQQARDLVFDLGKCRFE